MSQKLNVSTSMVSDFVRHLIENVGIGYKVERSGRVVKAEDNKPLMIGKVGQLNAEVYVYGEDMPNGVHIFNPFAEGFKDAPATRRFYEYMKIGIGARIFTLINAAASTALANKGKKSSDVPTKLLELASCFGNTIDEKTVDEIQALSKDLSQFAEFNYQRNSMITSLIVPMIPSTADQNEFMPSDTIRKKTLNAIADALRRIFDVKSYEELDKFKTSARENNDAPPMIFTLLWTMLKTYQQINPYLEIISPEFMVDLDMLSSGARNCVAYAANASWRGPEPVTAATANNASTQTTQVGPTNKGFITNQQTQPAQQVQQPVQQVMNPMQQSGVIISPNGTPIPAGAVAPGMMPMFNGMMGGGMMPMQQFGGMSPMVQPMMQMPIAGYQQTPNGMVPINQFGAPVSPAAMQQTFGQQFGGMQPMVQPMVQPMMPMTGQFTPSIPGMPQAASQVVATTRVF